MATNGNGPSQIPIYTLIAMILAASGLYYFQKPLKTFRPSEPSIESPSAISQVRARLWQDPLLAVRKDLRERKQQEAPGPAVAAEATWLSDEICKLVEARRSLLLPVMVPGGYSASDHETRLRSRYAVLAALDRAGYTTELRDRIKWVWVSVPDAEGGPSIVVPFEWCKPSKLHRGLPNSKGAKFEKILVLWLQDEKFLPEPVTRLNNEVNRLKIPSDNGLRVRILGPTDSDGLRAIYGEVAKLKKTQRVFSDLKIYSSWATADDSIIAPGVENDIIVRTIASDRDLACELISELDRRGVDCSSDHIAIISEWDTFYGRALPLTFASCVKDNGKWPTNIRRVTYLRGLDGKVLATETTDARANEDKRQTPDTIQELERPEGPSQIDYLRRLAERLHSREGRKLSAIGILGSDVYDKLLVLQAFRHRFPHAIFFTTDLDARLLHPSQTRWARNLVVASSYGLGLSDTSEETAQDNGFELGVPPFRGVYQTSLYAATLEALNCITKGERQKFSKARLYEVGRTRAHLLMDERKRDLFDAMKPWLLPMALALALGLCVSYLRRGFHLLPVMEAFRRLLPYLVFLLVIGLGGITIWKLFKYAPEPFAWFEGISIWPSEILRLAAAFLALHFLVKGHRMVSKSNADLYHEFQLPEKACPKNCAFPGRKWWRHKRPILFAPWPRGADMTDVKGLLAAYLLKEEPFNKWLRVGFLSGIYIVLGLCLIWTHGFPTVPYRGSASHCADKGILLLSVCLLVLLIFYVIDTTLLCERFISKLCKNPSTMWPPVVLESLKSGQVSPRKPRAELFSVNLIARRTDVVGALIPYPFFVLLLIIISRVSLFDRWDWPLGLIVVLGLNSFCAISCAVVLWRSARQARSRILESLKQRIFKNRVENLEADTLSLVIKEIERLRQGAFAPLAEQPVLRAILIPLGSIGSAVLLEAFATGF